MVHTEFEIIRRYFAESGLCFDKPGVELAIGDDGALLSLPPDRLLCMTMDVLAEGIHFPPAADPALVANRALAVNLSDLAAMGAEPFCFTLGLVMPHGDSDWLERFSAGLLALARRFQIPLVGGDTTKGPLSISIQAQGLLSPDAVIRRSGARPGDRIYVTGSVGDGAIALAAMGLETHLGESFQINRERLSPDCLGYFETAYYKPEPRVALAAACAPLVSSGIDISDGLYGDLGHILEVSGVGAVLQVDALPWSESARCCMSAGNRLRAALFGGDDYELCVTVAPQHCGEFERMAVNLDTRVSCIGTITEGGAIRCVNAAGDDIAIADHAYVHFQKET